MCLVTCTFSDRCLGIIGLFLTFNVFLLLCLDCTELGELAVSIDMLFLQKIHDFQQVWVNLAGFPPQTSRAGIDWSALLVLLDFSFMENGSSAVVQAAVSTHVVTMWSLNCVIFWVM